MSRRPRLGSAASAASSSAGSRGWAWWTGASGDDAAARANGARSREGDDLDDDEEEDDQGLWTQQLRRRRTLPESQRRLLQDDDLASIPTSVSPSVASSSVQSLFRRGGGSRLSRELFMTRSLDRSSSFSSTANQSFFDRSWSLGSSFTMRGSTDSGGAAAAGASAFGNRPGAGAGKPALEPAANWSFSVPTMILAGLVALYTILSVLLSLSFRLIGFPLPTLLAPILLIALTGVVLARPGTLASLLCTGINLVARRALGLGTRAEIGRIDLLRRRIDGIAVYLEDVPILQVEEVSLQFTSRAMHAFHGPTRPLLTLLVSGVRVNMLHALLEALVPPPASPANRGSSAKPVSSSGSAGGAAAGGAKSASSGARAKAGTSGASSSEDSKKSKLGSKLARQQKLIGRILWVSGFMIAEVDRVDLRFISSDVNFDFQARDILLSCGKPAATPPPAQAEAGGGSNSAPAAAETASGTNGGGNRAGSAGPTDIIAEARMTVGKFQVDVGSGMNATPVFHMADLCVAGGVAHLAEYSERIASELCTCGGSHGAALAKPSARGIAMDTFTFAVGEMDMLASHHLITAMRVVIGLQKESRLNFLDDRAGAGVSDDRGSSGGSRDAETYATDDQDLAKLSAERRIELSRKERLGPRLQLSKLRTSSEVSEDFSEMSVDSAGWECERCSFYNQPLDMVCAVCKLPLSGTAAADLAASGAVVAGAAGVDEGCEADDDEDFDPHDGGGSPDGPDFAAGARFVNDSSDDDEDDEDDRLKSRRPGTGAGDSRFTRTPEYMLFSILRRLPSRCELRVGTLMCAVQGESAKNATGGCALLHCQLEAQLGARRSSSTIGDEASKVVSRAADLSFRVQHMTGSLLPVSFERVAANQISVRDNRDFMLLPEIEKHTFMQTRDWRVRIGLEGEVAQGNVHEPIHRQKTTSINEIDDPDLASDEASGDKDQDKPNSAWNCASCNNRNASTDLKCALCKEPYHPVVVLPASWLEMSPVADGSQPVQNDHHHDTGIRVDVDIRKPEFQANVSAFECLASLKGALSQLEEDDDEDDDDVDDDDEEGAAGVSQSSKRPASTSASLSSSEHLGSSRKGRTPLANDFSRNEVTGAGKETRLSSKRDGRSLSLWVAEMLGVSSARTLRLRLEVSDATMTLLPLVPLSTRRQAPQGNTITSTRLQMQAQKLRVELKLDHAVPPALAALAIRNARKSGKLPVQKRHGVQKMIGAAEVFVGPLCVWQLFSPREAQHRTNALVQWSSEIPAGAADLDDSKRRARILHMVGSLSTKGRVHWDKGAPSPRVLAVKTVGAEPGMRVSLHGATALRLVALGYDYVNEYLRCLQTQPQPRKTQAAEAAAAASGSATRSSGVAAPATVSSAIATIASSVHVTVILAKVTIVVYAIEGLSNARHAFRLSLPEISAERKVHESIKLRLRKPSLALATSTSVNSSGTFHPVLKCIKISADLDSAVEELGASDGDAAASSGSPTATAGGSGSAWPTAAAVHTLDLKLYQVQITQGPEIEFGAALQALLQQRKALRQGLRDLAARRGVLPPAPLGSPIKKRPGSHRREGSSHSADGSKQNVFAEAFASSIPRAAATERTIDPKSIIAGGRGGAGSASDGSFRKTGSGHVADGPDRKGRGQLKRQRIRVKLQADEILVRFLHDKHAFKEDPRLVKYMPHPGSRAGASGAAKGPPSYVAFFSLKNTAVGLEWDSFEHSKQGLRDLVWAFDDCSSERAARAAHAHGFSFAMGGRIVQFDMEHFVFQLRDHRRPLAEAWSLSLPRATSLVLAELRGTPSCTSSATVVLSEAFPHVIAHDFTLKAQDMLDGMSAHPYGVTFRELPRVSMPMKIYYEMELNCAQLNVAHGDCLTATLNAFDVAFSRMLPKSSDKRSPKLGFWDRLRYLFHGVLCVNANRASVRLLTVSPWHGDTGLLIAGNALQLRNLRDVNEVPGASRRRTRRRADPDGRFGQAHGLAKRWSQNRSVTSDGSARDVMDWNTFFVPMSRQGSIRSRKLSSESVGQESQATDPTTGGSVHGGEPLTSESSGDTLPLAREWELTCSQLVVSAIRDERGGRVLQTTLLTVPRTRLQVSFRWGSNVTLDHYVQLQHAADARPWNIDDMYADFRSDGLDLGLKFELGATAAQDQQSREHHEQQQNREFSRAPRQEPHHEEIPERSLGEPPGEPSPIDDAASTYSNARTIATAPEEDLDDDAFDCLFPTVTLCWEAYPLICEIRRSFAPAGPPRTAPEKATFARLLTRLRIGILADRPRLLWWEEPRSEAAFFLSADSVVTRIEYIRPPSQGIDWAPPCGYPPSWVQHALLVQCSSVQSHFLPRAMPYLPVSDSAILVEERTYMDATGCSWRFWNTFPPPPPAILQAMSMAAKPTDNPVHDLPASEPWVMTPAIMLTAGQWQQMQASMRTRESIASQHSAHTFMESEDGREDEAFTIRIDEARVRWAINIRDAIFMVIGSVMFAYRQQGKVDERLQEEASRAMARANGLSEFDSSPAATVDEAARPRSVDSAHLTQARDENEVTAVATPAGGDRAESGESQELKERQGQFDGHFFGPLVDFDDAFAPQTRPSGFMADLLTRSDRSHSRHFTTPIAHVEHWVHDDESKAQDRALRGITEDDSALAPGAMGLDMDDEGMGLLPEEEGFPEEHQRDDAQDASESENDEEDAGELEFLVKVRWGQVFLRADADAAFVTGELATVRTYKKLMQCFDRVSGAEMPGFEMLRKQVDVSVTGAQVFTLTAESADERRDKCTPWVNLRRGYEAFCFTDTLEDYAFCFHENDRLNSPAASRASGGDSILRSTSAHRRNVNTYGGSGKRKGSIEHRPALERMNFTIHEVTFAIIPPDVNDAAKPLSPSDARVPRGKFLISMPHLDICLDSRSFFDILGVIRKLLLVMPSPDYTALLRKGAARDDSSSHAGHGRTGSRDWDDFLIEFDDADELDDSDSDAYQSRKGTQALLEDSFGEDDLGASDVDSTSGGVERTPPDSGSSLIPLDGARPAAASLDDDADSATASGSMARSRRSRGGHSRSRSVEMLPTEGKMSRHKPTASEMGLSTLDPGDLAAFRAESRHVRSNSKSSFSSRQSQSRRNNTFYGNISSRLRPRQRNGHAQGSTAGSVSSQHSGRARRKSIVSSKQLLSEAEAELVANNNSVSVLRKIVERVIGMRAVEHLARESELVYVIGQASIRLVEDGPTTSSPHGGSWDAKEGRGEGSPRQHASEKQQQQQQEQQHHHHQRHGEHQASPTSKVEYDRVLMHLSSLRGSHTFSDDGSTRVQISLGEIRVLDSMQSGSEFRDILRGYVVSSGSLASSRVPILRVDARTRPHFIVGDYKVNVYEMLQVLIYPGAPSYRLAVHLTYDAATFFMRFFRSEADDDLEENNGIAMHQVQQQQQQQQQQQTPVAAKTGASAAGPATGAAGHQAPTSQVLSPDASGAQRGADPLSSHSVMSGKRSRARSGSAENVRDAAALAVASVGHHLGNEAGAPQRLVRAGYILKRGRNDISWAAGRVRRNYCQLRVVRSDGDLRRVVLEYYRSDFETRLRLPPRGTVDLRNVILLEFSQDLGAPKHALDMVVQVLPTSPRGRADRNAAISTITYTFSPDLSGRRGRTMHPNVASAEWVAAMRPFCRKDVLGEDILRVLNDEQYRATFEEISANALKVLVSYTQRRGAAGGGGGKRDGHQHHDHQQQQQQLLLQQQRAGSFYPAEPWADDLGALVAEGTPLEMLRDPAEYERFLKVNMAKRYLLSKRRASAMGLLDRDTIRMYSGELMDLVYLRYVRTSDLHITAAVQGFPFPIRSLGKRRGECAAVIIRFELMTWQKFFSVLRHTVTKRLLFSIMGGGNSRAKERSALKEAKAQEKRQEAAAAAEAANREKGGARMHGIRRPPNLKFLPTFANAPQGQAEQGSAADSGGEGTTPHTPETAPSGETKSTSSLGNGLVGAVSSVSKDAPDSASSNDSRRRRGGFRFSSTTSPLSTISSTGTAANSSSGEPSSAQDRE